MNIETIEFICSSPSLRECPRQDLPEFAFIGRSNVGKSSLINMIAGRKSLAKISSTPGKTRLINHFRVLSGITIHPPSLIPACASSPDPSPQGEGGTLSPASGIRRSASWFLVDLPGYGFAKLSKSEREKFEGIIRNYLEKRENLALTFLLIDSRLEPQKIDVDFMNRMGDLEIPFVILFTKTDKLTRSQLASHLTDYKKSLSAYWSELPAMIPTSAQTRQGRGEILGTIEKSLIELSIIDTLSFHRL